MKKTLSTLILTVAVSLSAQALDLLSLGSTGFTPEGGAATYTQGASDLVFNGAMTLGDSVYGTASASGLYWTGTAYDWSSTNVQDFGIRMTITGTNPELPFSLQLYDSTFAISLFQGYTTGLVSGVEGEVLLTQATFDANLSDIIAVGIQWDAGGTINTSMAAITAVPEPSTYALLAMSAVAFGGYVIRRRRRA